MVWQQRDIHQRAAFKRHSRATQLDQVRAQDLWHQNGIIDVTLMLTM